MMGCNNIHAYQPAVTYQVIFEGHKFPCKLAEHEISILKKKQRLKEGM